MQPSDITTEEKKIKVLIVEDEAALADIYSTKLKMNDMEVMTAPNGLEGMSLAIQNKPSIILLDVMMPIKDGFETLQDLKLNPVTKDIPVVMLTNLGQDHEMRRGMKLGAHKFLTKALLTPDEVIKEVCDVLEETGSDKNC